MAVSQLDHLNMSVANLEESLDWYDRVFGFERVEGGVADGVAWAIARAGEALLCMYEHAEREVLDGAGLQAHRMHGFNHYGLRITDEAAWVETLSREGVGVLYGGVVDWPHSKAWYVRDPTGYEIEVALWKDDVVAFPEATAPAP